MSHTAPRNRFAYPRTFLFVSFRKHLDIAWWQWVPFFEAGRVAPRWTVGELHTKMQWDAGLGIRAMAKGLTVRIDTAVSNENWGVQMMIGHPFQF